MTNAPDNRAAGGSRASRSEYAWVVCLAIVPHIVKLVSYPRYVGSDDAYIHLTICRNLAEGFGWSVNPDVPVNASSSPLFTLLVTAGTKVGLDPFLYGMILTACFASGSILLVHALLHRRHVGPQLRLFGVSLAAMNVHLWRWNATIMETVIALFLVAAAFLAYERARDSQRGQWRTGVFIGLAVLTRLECGLLGLSIGLALLVERRSGWFKHACQLSIGAGVAVLPWLLFAKSYFGSILPSTFYAKTAPLTLVNGVVFRQLAEVIGGAFAIPLLGSVILLLWGATRKKKPSTEFWRAEIHTLAFPLLLFAFYYLKTPGLQSPARYYLPALFSIPIVCTHLAFEARTWMGTRAMRTVVTVVALAHAAVSLTINQTRVTPVLRGFSDNYEATMTDATNFVLERTRREQAVLVVVDIGVISYVADGRFVVIDAGALASPELLNLSVPQMVERTRPAFIIRTQVTSWSVDDLPSFTEVWKRTFASHGVGNPSLTFTTTIYQSQ